MTDGERFAESAIDRVHKLTSLRTVTPFGLKLSQGAESHKVGLIEADEVRD